MPLHAVPEVISLSAIRVLIAARLAARDAEWRQAIEALPDQMAESWVTVRPG